MIYDTNDILDYIQSLAGNIMWQTAWMRRIITIIRPNGRQTMNSRLHSYNQVL